MTEVKQVAESAATKKKKTAAKKAAGARARAGKAATAKPAVAKKAAAKRATTRKAAPAKARRAPASPAERHSLIAQIAFLKAERREFRGGDPVQDWLEAEKEVDSSNAG